MQTILNPADALEHIVLPWGQNTLCRHWVMENWITDTRSWTAAGRSIARCHECQTKIGRLVDMLDREAGL